MTVSNGVTVSLLFLSHCTSRVTLGNTRRPPAVPSFRKNVSGVPLLWIMIAVGVQWSHPIVSSLKNSSSNAPTCGDPFWPRIQTKVSTLCGLSRVKPSYLGNSFKNHYRCRGHAAHTSKEEGAFRWKMNLRPRGERKLVGESQKPADSNQHHTLLEIES